MDMRLAVEYMKKKIPFFFNIDESYKYPSYSRKFHNSSTYI